MNDHTLTVYASSFLVLWCLLWLACSLVNLPDPDPPLEYGFTDPRVQETESA